MSKFKVTTHRVFPKRVGKATIYMVTCYEPSSGQGKGIAYEPAKRRCWGWFKDKKRAIQAVMNNETDMFELGWYTYAVVEEVPSGIIPISKALGWFEFDHKKKTVKKTETPLFAKHVCNFSIG